MNKENAKLLNEKQKSDEPEPEEKPKRSGGVKFSEPKPLKSALKSRPVEPDPSKKWALIVMNMQNDFFTGPVKIKAANSHYTKSINILKDEFDWDLVVITQTSHPVHHQSFVTNVPASETFVQSSLKAKGGDEILVMPEHCMIGTFGAELHSKLKVSPEDVVIETGLTADLRDTGAFSTISSVQYENVCGLHLDRAGITDVVIVGLDTDGEGILATVDHLRDSPIKAYVLSDLCHLCFEVDEMWDITSELNARVLTLDEFHHQLNVPMKLPSNHHVWNGFREEMWAQLMATVFVNDSTGVDAFDAIMATDPCAVELTTPHPKSGLFFVHVLAGTNTIAAAAILDKLLDEKRINISEKSKGNDMSPLMVACQKGCVSNARVLINNPVQKDKLNMTDYDCYQRTAMMYAVMQRDIDMVETLFFNKAEGDKRLIHALDSCRRSVLQQAIHYAGENPRGTQYQQVRGRQVLDLLWEHFESGDMLDTTGDIEGWTTWNYLVKHDMTHYLKLAIATFTMSNDEQEERDRLTQTAYGDEAKVAENTRLNIHGQGAIALGMIQRRGSAQLPGALRKTTSQASMMADRHRRSYRAPKVAKSGRTVRLEEVLLQTISFSQNLLHQAVWQRKKSMCLVLMPLYNTEGLMHETIENGMGYLDLTMNESNPNWSFMLITHGCVPKQSSGLPMYQLVLKAIMLGQSDVVRASVMAEEFGVVVDLHMLDIITRMKTIQTCTSSYSSSSAPLTQPSYSCEECESQRPHGVYCVMCVLFCHADHKGVKYEGTASFHCADAAVGSCNCKKGGKSMDFPYDSILEGDSLLELPDTTNEKPRTETRRFSVRDGTNIRFVLPDVHDTPTGGAAAAAAANALDEFARPRTSRFGNAKDKAADAVGEKKSGKTASFATESVIVGTLSPARANMGARPRSFRRELTNNSLENEDTRSPAQIELGNLLMSVSYRDHLRHILLMACSKRSQIPVIEELAKWIKPDMPVDESLNRALHLAAQVGSLRSCAILKRHGARASVTNAQGETPLHIAAQFGHVDVCDVISTPSSVLKMDNHGLTPLHHAVRNNHPEVVDALCSFLKHRSKVPVDINSLFFSVTVPRAQQYRHSLTKKTSLIANSRNQAACDLKSVSEDIKRRDAGEAEGHATPLHLAVRYGHVKCASVLMKHGASPIAADATGFTAYQTALWEQYTSRKKLEHHQTVLSKQRKESNSAGKKMRFFDGFRLTELGHDVEAQIDDMNRDLADRYRTLGLKTTHEIVDEMNKSSDVRSARKQFAYQHLVKWVFGYLFILSLFISFSVPRTDRRYLFARSLSDVVQKNEWEGITNFDHATDWMQTNLVSEATLTHPVIGNSTFMGVSLLGAVRLRQIRSTPTFCTVPDYLDSDTAQTHCVPGSFSNDERRPLDFSPDTSGLDAVNTNLVNSALTWREGKGSASDLDFGDYTENGYFVDLDLQSRTPEQNRALLAVLLSPDSQGRRWFDTFTRSVQINYSYYNANMDVWGSVALYIEQGAAAELLATFEVLSFHLARSFWDTYPSPMFQVACLFVFFFMISNVIGTVVRRSWRQAFRKRGIWFDLSIGVVVLSLMVIDIVVIVTAHVRDLDLSETSKYQEVFDILRLLEKESFVVSFMVLLMWLRLIKYSVLLPRFGHVTFAFMNTMKNFEVVSYLLFMFFVVLGFVCAYRTAFGQIERTSTYTGAFNVLMQMMMGEWSESLFFQLPEVMSSFLFVAFMISVAVVFINLFISVLSEVYPREKLRARTQCDDNLTGLLQTDYIMATHPMLQVHARTGVGRFLQTNVVHTLYASVGVLLRNRYKHWNFDEPKVEFGWEKGREEFRQRLCLPEHAQGV